MASEGFPMNVVDLWVEELSKESVIQRVFDRPLEPTDPSPSVAIVPADWMPNDFVMGQAEPAVGTYLFLIQAFCKNSNKAEGIREHTILAKTIRTMLYRNGDLRVRLRGLTESSLGITERTQRMGIRQQRFMTNEAPQGTFLFLTTSEFWLETETVGGL